MPHLRAAGHCSRQRAAGEPAQTLARDRLQAQHATTPLTSLNPISRLVHQRLDDGTRTDRSSARCPTFGQRAQAADSGQRAKAAGS